VFIRSNEGMVWVANNISFKSGNKASSMMACNYSKYIMGAEHRYNHRQVPAIGIIRFCIVTRRSLDMGILMISFFNR